VAFARRCSKEFLSRNDGPGGAPLRGRGRNHDDARGERGSTEQVERRRRHARKTHRPQHDLTGTEHDHDCDGAQPRDHVVDQQQLDTGRSCRQRAQTEQHREVRDVGRRGCDAQRFRRRERAASNRTEPPSAGVPMQDGTGDGGLPHRNSSRTLAAHRR
jgi:hypothetical protein